LTTDTAARAAVNVITCPNRTTTSWAVAAGVTSVATMASRPVASEIDLADAPPTLATRLRRPSTALIAGLLVIGLVTVVTTAVVSLLFASGPRLPIVPDQFGGNPPVASASASPTTASASVGPTASDEIPPIFAVGDAIPLFDASGTVGDVTVVRSDAEAAASGSGVVVVVEFRYKAVRDLVVDPTAWVALRADGETAASPPPADKQALAAGALKAGESRTGWLAFELLEPADTLLVDYRFFESTLFSVQLY
jgi:hypothetical protein